jgi:hypothetical protein
MQQYYNQYYNPMVGHSVYDQASANAYKPIKQQDNVVEMTFEEDDTPNARKSLANNKSTEIKVLKERIKDLRD